MKTLKKKISVLLAAALVVAALTPALTAPAGAAVTQGDIQAIKGQISDVAARKQEAEERLAAIRGDLSRAQEQVELVQEQVLLTEQQVGAGRELLAQYDRQIEDNQQEVADLEAKEAEQLEEFYRQVRWMEETGGTSYLSILFHAKSFSDLLDYAMLVTDIMEYSDRIIDELQATQRELNGARETLQASRDQQAQAQSDLEARLAELEEQKAQASALLAQIAASESEYAQEAAQLAAEEAETERALKEAEDKWAAQIAAAAAGASGDWYWPVPGYYSITSMFGGRYHPITGVWESHTGTDIGVPRGVEIHAAQDGVVTTVGRNPSSSYGNYVIISHGNGYATLYAHMLNSPPVSVGQPVSRGEVIGNVGMTGSANGYHLHFELRVNGVRDNVLKLYPNVNFIDNT